MVEVRDTGIGIPSDKQGLLFERFSQADSSITRNYGGTGLGLSIVKHVISNHGGEVTVWSQPGRGSTFTVRLPEMEPDAGVQLGRSVEARGGNAPAAGEGAQS